MEDPLFKLTSFFGHLFFMVYVVCTVIVALNMLIAMMNSSYGRFMVRVVIHCWPLDPVPGENVIGCVNQSKSEKCDQKFDFPFHLGRDKQTLGLKSERFTSCGGSFRLVSKLFSLANKQSPFAKGSGDDERNDTVLCCSKNCILRIHYGVLG